MRGLPPVTPGENGSFSAGAAPGKHAYEGSGDTVPGRLAGVGLASTTYDVEYGYDGVGRLDEIVSASAVTSSDHTFEYGYLADSGLLETLTETGSEFTISRAYEDHRDLLTQIKAEIPDGGGGTNVVSQYDYAYDSIGLRSSVVNSGTAFSTNALNLWTYNDRGELVTSDRHLGTDPSNPGTAVSAQARDYLYDPIGNRQWAMDANSSPPTICTRNNLNQYTQTYYPSETFDYDEDGNMTEDGTFEYTWNGENRLIQVQPKTPASGDLRLTFSYDFMGRRVQKVVETYDGSSWSTNAVAKFVWDGWLLIAELDGMDSDALIRTYTWGLDLSGTFTGAGGIAGLLMVDDDAGDGFCGYYAYDGNGNVGQVLDAEDLSTDAHYEYDPYGREIVASGTYADENPWRFSTKYLDVLDPNDADASLLYYGFRSCAPRLGRWPSRDPIEKVGGPNLYLFVENAPVLYIDPVGLLSVSAEVTTYHGSVEWHKGRRSGKYLNTDPSGPERYVRRHATIDSGIVGTVTAWMDSSTRMRGYWRNPDSFQMSNFLYGKLKICDCCCDGGQVEVRWKLSASMTASGRVGGANATSATFDGESLIVRSNDPSQTRTGTKTYACPSPPACLELSFDVGAGWFDYDSMGAGVVSKAKVTAVALCPSGGGTP